jgi:hypothetical protein
MKKLIIALSLTLTLVLASVSMCLYQSDRFSIDHWKQESGYTGPVCIVAIDTHNNPYCENGVPYTPASVNAGEGYGLWVDCMEYHAPYACRDLND